MSERTYEGLSPCPFCGSLTVDYCGPELYSEQWVDCQNCGAQVSFGALIVPKKQFIKKWNTRAGQLGKVKNV